jgi:hypothetical protein
VTIEHGPAPRDASGQTGYLPFDMWWSHSDPNGFPITPDWSQRMLARPDTTPVPTLDTCNHFRHVASGVSLTDKSGQPCASYEAGIDTPNSVATIVACKPNSGIGIEGHINIGVATYYGWLSGGDHTPRSSDINPNNWGDDDYNLDLHTTFDDLAATPFETAGVFGAQTAHKLEFEAHETVDVFWSSWWSQTHANVDSGSWASFDGNYAVVTGLIGIDNVHQGQAEIHPVYAMAIRLPPSTDATLEQWALFIRDSGTEGGCGHDDEHHDVRFPGGQFTFKLPWHPGMARAAVDSGGTVIEYIDPSGSRLATRPTSVASTPDSDGLLVTFDGFHQGSPMVDGVLALRWTPCTADVANDPRNCGRCGHVCKGAGVCAAGTCASPAPPGAALKVVCDGALGVQIASSAPAAGNDGAPLSIVFRRGPSATGPWTDLTAYAPGPRLFVDAPLPGAPSPWTWAVPTFYEVCIKDSAQQESCSTSSTEVPVNETLTSCPNGCTDLQSDPNNCGTCGHYCPFGCYQAQCMTAPPPPPTGQKCGSQRCAANKQCCQDPQGGTYYCAQKCM